MWVKSKSLIGFAFQGANYFNAVPLPTFSNGGGDLVSNNLPAAVFELAQIIEAAELAQPIVDEKNISTSSLDTSNNIFAFQSELNVTMTQTVTGATQFVPVAYLP
jgi:hypothetical protein